MSFADAIKTCLAKYADFSGRARRSEYWFFSLAILLAYVVCIVVTAVVKPLGILLIVVLVLAAIVPGLAVSIRRLHDTGKSGWWYLIGFVPFVGGIILLVFMVSDSGPDNMYGPNPKGAIGYGTAPM
ncbi:MAG: hypothetical protein JWM40_696 [Frankiales bacterium]|nr:hypothetical protein [Frankiales bacterium]